MFPGDAMKFKHLAIAAASCVAFGGSHAVQVVPVSYSMANGASGTYQYWDDTYSGNGCITCDGSPLSGGRGDLTDGIIASSNWQITEAPAGPGPYVGWTNFNPTISFHFGQTVSIGSVTVYMDDSQFGGVVAPASVVIGSTTYPVIDPAGTAPFAFTVTGLNFVGTDLDVTVNRNGQWVFLSEVQFQSPVPEAQSAWMLTMGLVTTAWVVRRRRQSGFARQS